MDINYTLLLRSISKFDAQTDLISLDLLRIYQIRLEELKQQISHYENIN